ncbi:class I SAM-dependent methyltransferase [Lysinibacillus xylanilyticus]|uniref:class I SAM-dependent methyltransferase n=1 Tax=Lysinibacillus xylanilyticus TaxID=582475 RepID=UPI003817E3B6
MKQNIYDNNTFLRNTKKYEHENIIITIYLKLTNLFTLIPPLKNKVVLDIGCGMGDFATYCISQGAKHVTGIDISSNMVANAKKRYIHVCLTFEQATFEDMTVQNGTIDFVSSSLAFHYTADFQLLNKKISKALCERGILLFSLEHPIVTANKGKENWITNHEGNLLHFAVDNYQDEGLRSQNWLVDDVVTYHHTMYTILNTLIESGLHIERIIEPIPTKEAVCNLPSLYREFVDLHF